MIDTPAATEVAFGSERVAAVWDEIYPLLERNWQESSQYNDLPFRPDKNFYLAMDTAKAIRVFTLRVKDVLVGYATYFVLNNIQCGIPQAQQDILFIEKSHRGKCGYKFMRWCDQQLAGENVRSILCHVQAESKAGAVFKRMGYAAASQTYYRRVN